MEAGRGTPVAYHYVSVMMIKLYVESFHNRKADRGAIALSNQVAALVNQGRSSGRSKARARSSLCRATMPRCRKRPRGRIVEVGERADRAEPLPDRLCEPARHAGRLLEAFH